MKIIGTGVDIIENKRILRLIKNPNFIKRVFNQQEIISSKNPKNKQNFFAKRFAAKEAFSKALGTGFRNKLNYRDIEISNDEIGKPYFKINTKIKKLIQKLFKIKSFNFFLSISDEKKYSIAFVILQKKWN